MSDFNFALIHFFNLSIIWFATVTLLTVNLIVDVLPVQWVVIRQPRRLRVAFQEKMIFFIAILLFIVLVRGEKAHIRQ